MTEWISKGSEPLHTVFTDDSNFTHGLPVSNTSLQTIKAIVEQNLQKFANRIESRVL